MTHPEPQATTPLAPPAGRDATLDAALDPTADALVEEVSIDGMCGVY